MARVIREYNVVATQPDPADPNLYKFTFGTDFDQNIDVDNLNQMMNEAATYQYLLGTIAQMLAFEGINPYDFNAVKTFLARPQSRIRV